jgi:hypothetical protein
MKTTLMIQWLCALSVSAAPLADLASLAETASVQTGRNYLDARDEIVKLGSQAKPELYRLATDSDADWKLQLMARICYEQIERRQDIEAVRTHDWKSYPPYAKPGSSVSRYGTDDKGKIILLEVVPPPDGHVEIPMTGASSLMSKHVLPVLREAGLWYYYIEQVWKQTGEGPPAMKFDHLFMERWVGWCAAVVKEQPEKIWWARAVGDRLQGDDFLNWRNRLDFRQLIESGIPEGFPFVLARYDDFCLKEHGQIKTSGDTNAISYRGLFERVFGLASPLNADQLETFITARPLLSGFQPRLEEVRKRDRNLDDLCKVFRLGSTVVSP